MKKISWIILLFLAFSAILGVFAYMVLPWKTALGNGLQALLQRKGIEARLTLSEIGLRQTRFEKLSLGAEDSPLTLNNVELGYSPLELLKGGLNDLKISGLLLEIRQQDGRWAIKGFGGAEKSAPISGLRIPVLQSDLASVPVNDIIFSDSQLLVIADKWTLTAPFTLEWHKLPVPAIAAEFENMHLKINDISASAPRGKADMKLSETNKSWGGPWELQDLQINAFPPLAGKGVLKAETDYVSAAGILQNGDRSYHASFNLEYLLGVSEPGKVTISEAGMPWKGGTLAVQNVTIPLARTKPLHVNVRVREVSVGALMETLTGKRVSATGNVSGNLPLTIGTDNSITLGDAQLQAEGPGTITMPPDLIPGDNEQVALTRRILQNFHYNGLTVSASGGKDGLALLVMLEGNNPDVEEGRPVKLNVRLTGDILDFIKQNAMLITDPKSILQQGGQ